MSFILDALKKLEKEKAARKNGTINISNEILRDTYQPRRKPRRATSVTVVVAGLAVLLLGASGIYLWQKRGPDDASKTVASPLAHTAPAVVHTPALPDKMPVPAATPTVMPTATPVAMVTSQPSPSLRQGPRNTQLATRTEAQRPPQVRERDKKKSTVAQQNTRDNRPDRSPRPYRQSYDANQSAAPNPSPPPTPTPAPAMSPGSGSGSRSGLTVSGIAWQEKPAARRAVVNGTLLEEGATVDGATIEEIQPTRVYFSSGGRKFSLPISGPQVTK